MYVFLFCTKRIFFLLKELKNIVIHFNLSLILGNGLIRWLGEEALKRYEEKFQTSSDAPSKEEIVSGIRKMSGGTILDFDAAISDVLNDKEFVRIGKSFFLIQINKWALKNFFF